MNRSDFVATLREIEFLQDVEEEHLERLAEIAEPKEFQFGEVIFRQGDPAEKIYIVLSGNISLEMCAPSVGCRNLITLGPGDILAWSAVLEQTRLTATARAMGSVSLAQFQAGLLLGQCGHNPRFGFEIMRRTALALAKRLGASWLQMMDVYGNPPITPAPGIAKGGKDAG